LNAAQSGARSLNLNHQIDYLLDHLDSIYETGVLSPTDWKLMTVFIGSNDICHSCTEVTSLPPAFGVNVLAAVERLRTSMSNVLVQISKLCFTNNGIHSNLDNSWTDESTRYRRFYGKLY
jgi:phospholipase B1